MDDAKAFLLGLMQTARDRFGNPLIGAFAIAWALWNFRIILILLGSGEGGWKAKIEHIDTKLMPHWYDWAIHCYAVPAIFAVFWIYVLPPVLRKVAAHHERNMNRNREAIFAITESRTLSVDEAMYMRQVLLKQRAEWQTEKAQNLQALENYNKNLEDFNKEIASLKKQISEKETEISTYQEEIKILKSPPPKEPFDFSGKSTEEKADAIGLILDSRPTEPNDLATVLFDGKHVAWPWTPNDEDKFNMPTKEFFNESIDELILSAAIYLYERYEAQWPSSPFEKYSMELQKGGFLRSESIVRKLFHARILQGDSVAPSLPGDSVHFIRWLKFIGFSRAKQD